MLTELRPLDTALSMEGLFNPLDFSFQAPIQREKVLGAIVKVRPLRTLEYSIFNDPEDARAFSRTTIDPSGQETIHYGLLNKDRRKCADPEFAQGLFTHEFCELAQKDLSFPATTQLKGHGNGVLISNDGYIVTNFHLVSGSAVHLGYKDGYQGAANTPISNIEVEILERTDGNILIYKQVESVAFAGTYSEKDAYGNRLDLALLKIQESTPNHLKISHVDPKRFDQIYSVGFSMRTARSQERKQLLGYEDASYDLRVSTGLIVKTDGEYGFIADTDGAPGNSGSAAVNQNGELVGIYFGSTGNGIVDPSKSYRRYVAAKWIKPLLEPKLAES